MHNQRWRGYLFMMIRWWMVAKQRGGSGQRRVAGRGGHRSSYSSHPYEPHGLHPPTLIIILVVADRVKFNVTLS